jgi:hypothetical protein
VQYFSWHPNHASLVLPLWTWAGMSCLSSIVSTSDSIHGARSRCIYIFLFSCLWCEKKIVFNSQTVSTLVTWVLWLSFFQLRRCVFDNNSSTSWQHNMLRLSYLLTYKSNHYPCHWDRLIHYMTHFTVVQYSLLYFWSCR